MAFLIDDLAVAEQVLDVMADLVGDDVGLREFRFRAAELAFKLVEEGGIEINRLVGRAVEWPDLRGRRAATGFNAIGKRTMCGGT